MQTNLFTAIERKQKLVFVAIISVLAVLALIVANVSASGLSFGERYKIKAEQLNIYQEQCNKQIGIFQAELDLIQAEKKLADLKEGKK